MQWTAEQQSEVVSSVLMVQHTQTKSKHICSIDEDADADVLAIVAEYNIPVRAYADDDQLYIHCQPKDAPSAVLSASRSSSRGWLPANSDLT